MNKSILLILSVFIILSCNQEKSKPILRIDLNTNWQLQSSVLLSNGGEKISSRDFQTTGWHRALVPGTVLGSLVADSTFTDIFMDRNLEKIPDSLFIVPWWYRTVFNIEPGDTAQIFQLRFNGINYRADIWVNGEQVASSDSVEGGFRRFTFDISKWIKAGDNALAVKITRPYPGELTVGFVDWNPTPPDHSMGIWRNVELLVSGVVSIDQPFVQTKVDTSTLKHADLTVSALVQNHSDNEVSGKLKGKIGNEISFEKEVKLGPGEDHTIVFTPQEYKQLSVDNPKLWWVHTWGEPHLYDLHLSFEEGSQVTDTNHIRFGIRQVDNYFTEQGYRGFKLNGKKILIKGGGWVDKMLLDASPEYEEAGIDYAVHLGLNALRMEGFWGQNQHLYDLCDEKGIMLMAGFSCHWEWKEYLGTPDDEFSAIITPEQNDIAAESWRDQIIWLRHHPSIFTWLYGSDKRPRPSLEERYIATLKQYDTTRVAISSAADYTPGVDGATEHISQLSGPSAVKMRGPYDYEPPAYWYVDTTHGGAFGFNTETSPGPEITVRESLEKMIPRDSLWPINTSWLFHAARNNFYNFTYYNRALEQRLGAAKDLTDFLRKAQYMNYEGMRAMFEAFETNRYKSTGIIQWMYNASWPKLWWQLYDYYLMPTGAFYAAKKANEPLHILYNYGSNAVDLINNTLEDASALNAAITVYDFGMKELIKKEVPVVQLKERGTKEIFKLPGDLALSKTWFLDLRLKDNSGKVLSTNFYVLSTQQYLLNEPKTTWFVTPQSQYADLKMLNNLPSVKLKMNQTSTQKDEKTYVNVDLENPSDHLALMVHLDLKRGDNGESVVPVFWDDNYVTLLPGEKRTLTVYCHTRDLNGEKTVVKLDGWSVE